MTENATPNWQPANGDIEGDLRSRLACIQEATYWDRPYDERIAAIRGMCDLATNGMTPHLTAPARAGDTSGEEGL